MTLHQTALRVLLRRRPQPARAAHQPEAHAACRAQRQEGRKAQVPSCLVAFLPYCLTKVAPVALVATLLVIPQPQAASDRTALHVLNRITFGARPSDVDRVRRIGVAAFVEAQLHPERIADDGVKSRLGAFESLQLSSREIAQRYEVPAL